MFTRPFEVYEHFKFYDVRFNFVFTTKKIRHIITIGILLTCRFFYILGALLNVSMLPIDVVGATPFMKGLKGRLEVHLKVNHDNNTLTLGLTAKACVNSTCIFNKPVFNRTEIPGKIPVNRN